MLMSFLVVEQFSCIVSGINACQFYCNHLNVVFQDFFHMKVSWYYAFLSFPHMLGCARHIFGEVNLFKILVDVSPCCIHIYLEMYTIRFFMCRPVVNVEVGVLLNLVLSLMSLDIYCN